MATEAMEWMVASLLRLLPGVLYGGSFQLDRVIKIIGWDASFFDRCEQNTPIDAFIADVR